MPLTARLALACVFVLTATAASPTPFWTPDAAQVSRLEALAKPAGKMAALSKYDRDYAGTTVAGHKVIEGRWVQRSWNTTPQTPNPKIVPFANLPDIDDGGCSVVTVMYDVESEKIVLLECNGFA